MANPGAGTKFVPVNLSRSYGHQHNNNNNHTYPGHGSTRARPGGGGGSMLVLSRPRSSQKAAGPKLSIPPPLNLPSLRKEHQRFDSAGSSGGAAGAGGVGIGPRLGSSGIGWTKPVAAAVIVAPLESDQTVVDNVGGDLRVTMGSGVSGSAYMPPSSRTISSGPSQGYLGAVAPEKVTVLRGEDFPSLRAALPSASSGSEKKQRDGAGQKQKHVGNEDSGNGQRDGFNSSQLVDMVPHSQSRSSVSDAFDGDSGQNSGFGGGSVGPEKDRKQEDYLPGLLPLVRMNPRSDWEDDERDTGHSFIDRGRDHGFPKVEAYWERDYDFPWPGVLPQKPLHNVFERRGLRESDSGKISFSEVNKVDTNSRDVRTSSGKDKEGNSWRVPVPLSKEGFSAQEVGNGNDVNARPSSTGGERNKENKYIPSPFRDNSRNDTGRRDVGYNQGGRQPWSNKLDSVGIRGPEWNAREHYGNEQCNRSRGDAHQNKFVTKSSFSSSGGKVHPVHDPILSFGRDKLESSKNGKHYLDDPFTKDVWTSDFDGRDPFSVGLAGLVKKKKDVLKQTNFHDPVRESFEAELERVQKMQELERQRMIEEQERAMELPRREEEERIRLAREQEEMQRRLEEEAREAAWRAEQERSEAMRRAEEQRAAREEEKCRILLEEERRKQAARQKLLELEERIAKRQVETNKGANSSSGVTDEKTSGMAFEKDVFKVSDTGDWEDGERMVERITTSASSDSSMMNRLFEVVSKPHFSRDGPFVGLDRGKAVDSWKRDALDPGNGSSFFSQDQENGHHSPRWDASVGGRSYSTREFYGGPGFTSSRAYHKGGNADPHMDEFGQTNSQRWNSSGNADHHNRSLDMEFQDNLADRYGDSGWTQGCAHENVYPPYHERMYQNPESGRPQYSMRQPCVLPPPSVSSGHRNPDRCEKEQPGASTFRASEMQYNHVARTESTFQTSYDGSHRESLAQAEMVDEQQQSTETEVQKLDGSSARCDSQSSFSVSSPPDTPAHLSHDDLEESGDSPVLLASKGKDETLLVEGNECVPVPPEAEKDNVAGSGMVSTADDEERTIKNNGELQEPEEYDEEESYEEEDEVHDGEDENLKLALEFEGMDLEGNVSPEMDNLVLCFNEGVEVRLPNDELERSSRNEENSIGLPGVSVDSLKEQVSFDQLCSDGLALQSVDGSTQVINGNASRILLETETALCDLAIQSKNVPQVSAASELKNHVDVPECSILPNQSQIPSSSSQVVKGTVSPSTSQPEAPLNLQFGLFSGPPLIPSPVPAIQIGSIQMPLHLHPSIGPSLSNMHPPHPPLFHFGHLRYTSPISQGILPLAPQSIPSGQPSVPGLPSRHLDLSRGVVSKDGTVVTPGQSAEDAIKSQQVSRDPSHIGDTGSRPELGIQAEDSNVKNLKTSHAVESEDQCQAGSGLSQSVSKQRNLGMSKSRGPSSGGREKRYVVTGKDSGSRSLLQAPETSRVDAGGFQKRVRCQRTEYQVCKNANKMNAGLVSSYSYGADDKFNMNGRKAGARSTFRQVVSNRQPKQASESQGSNSQLVSFQGGDEKEGERESSRRMQSISPTGEHVDTPLQSGVVRIYEQPGIEAPSDDDDFIEVRSKRQMLNERREQREREMKAKPRVSKVIRKPRSTQSAVASTNLKKASASAVAEASNCFASDFVASKRHGLVGMEKSAGFKSPIVSQPLPPIGTPAAKSDANAQVDKRSQQIKSLQTSSMVSDGRKSLASDSIYDSGDKLLDNTQASLGSWGNSCITQKVMALTQTQLDEAMKPAHFDSHSAVGDSHNTVGQPSLPSSSILAKEKPLSSAASPVNSLLAGEKIQFGAVTSPTILPPTNTVPHGIGLPGPRWSAAEDNTSLFFEKKKNANEACTRLQDCEAEAEAAASAVAVAAITNDENGPANVPNSAVDSKSFVGADVDSVSAGAGCGDWQSQARPDEPLNVALPADLSVETPPIPLWPPLSSPQNSSSPMLSHVPGGPPSHFPFYEMNPLLGGHIFAFGRPDESASHQSQAQKSNATVSGPFGTWQHHSGVDSIYGPPAGFAGPFISPPGSIPGVQGPPHMVVYNHFASVGQFGQVGLSFMGTAYIPSGKQPDWKHIPTSSAMGVGEGVMNGMHVVSSQCNPTNTPAPVQHLAPRSPLLPMASPVAMFDVSPFQTSPDVTVQTRWSHVPASPIQPVQANMPMQQQAEIVLPPSNQPLAADRFSECQSQTDSDNCRGFAVTTDATVTRLPDELGLVESSSNVGTSTLNVATKSASANATPDASKKDTVQNGNGNNSTGQNISNTFKTQPSHKNPSAQQYGSSSGYNNQRGGGVSHKNGSGAEWTHRRMGYQGRSQYSGTEKNFSKTKMKQIYVAKKTPGGTLAPS